MRYYYKILILLIFFVVSVSGTVSAETKFFLSPSVNMGWGQNHQFYREYKKYHPYLENSRHLQIPQWEREDWYVEDWTSQTDGMTLIQGFYAADILRDQKTGHADLPILVVGPNFYHLSGLDKRRVVTTVDAVYGMTTQFKDSSFVIEDWRTCRPIGTFDQYGLRLH